MAATILAVVGADKPQEVISTTITAYAISSVFTGLAFLLMGIFRVGYIIGFIPRHILIGCIGGVGWFLVATGLEVSARLEGSLNYDFKTLLRLFQPDTFPLWIVPMLLGIFIHFTDCRIPEKYHKYYLPGVILGVGAIFYFFVFALDPLNLPFLRTHGWVFDGPKNVNEPWWHFYTLYGKLIPSFPHVSLLMDLRFQKGTLGRSCRNNTCYVCPDLLWRSSRSYQCAGTCKYHAGGQREP